jgi:hypothetical protein
MQNRLLDRQASLLAYLTSDAAIFGNGRDAPADGALAGIDPALLHLEARFSYEKRLEKIAAIFPRTLALLGDRADAMLRDFAEACPPADISRVANARQFRDFVMARWHEDPPYLTDVTACELACSVAGVAGEDIGSPTLDEGPACPGIRRNPGVVLLRCDYDIQRIFEQGAAGDPPRRDAWLAVALEAGTNQPRVFEVPAPVFDLLAALDDWTEPRALAGAARADELLRDLAAHGLIEIRA